MHCIQTIEDEAYSKSKRHDEYTLSDESHETLVTAGHFAERLTQLYLVNSVFFEFP